MLLSELIADLEGVLKGARKDPEIKRVIHNSREIEKGDIFCCLKGESTDGHFYVKDAVTEGAVAILSEEPVAEDVPNFLVKDVRSVLPNLSSRIVENPSKDLQVVGVTGTNGKTSVVSLLSEILQNNGISSAIIGTLTGALTTPESPELQRQLRKFCDNGVEVACMEVSSHSLVQNRVHETFFSTVAFTNLSHDHLDFHNTMEEYFNAKALLFSSYFSDRAVIATDQEYGRLYYEKAIKEGMDAEGVSFEDRNVIFDRRESSFDWRGKRVSIPLGGPFISSNALIASEIGLQLGLDISDVVGGLSAVKGIDGRFESLQIAEDIGAIIDYAHTPSALAELLRGCRKIVDGRIILVFGCGGDRDLAKRPLMGAVASSGADLNILTSDNPRTEDPEKIISEVIDGMTRQPTFVEVNRSDAVEYAISEASPGDLVVIAGRGHETHQEIQGEKIPLSDKDVLLAAVGKLFPTEEQ